MNIHAKKAEKQKYKASTSNISQLKQDRVPADQHQLKTSVSTLQLKLQQLADSSTQSLQLKSFQQLADQNTETSQLQAIGEQPEFQNKTGMPDNLKAGVENLSGINMDDVKVHYNSDKPTQLLAHAYAQGTDIHIAPGQEQHLPHEAWHVVQQKQGRVQPTMQLKGQINVNDDSGLEHEADEMGKKALQI